MVDICEMSKMAAFKRTSLHVLQAPGAADHLAKFPHSRGTRYVLPLDLDNAVNVSLLNLYGTNFAAMPTTFFLIQNVL